MPEVPLPSERALRGDQLRSVTGDADAAARAILVGSKSRGEYDAEKWYGAAYNNHDHTERIRLAVHPDVARAINRALYGGQLTPLGIDTPNKFFRACLVDGLHKLAAQTGDPNIARLAASENASAQLDALNAAMEKDKQTLDKFDEFATKASTECDWRRLSEAVEWAEITLTTMNEPYYSRLRQRIDYFATRVPH